MSEGFPYADIVILALIAGFILLRLRSVLGEKGESDGFNYFNRATLKPPLRDAIVRPDDKSLKAKEPAIADPYATTLTDQGVAKTLSDMKELDPQFSATQFLQGAKAAYEMVFDAFVKGDKDTLKMLMSPPIFQHFAQEIDKRVGEANKTETTLVSTQAKEIMQASLERTTARLSVKFLSEQVTVTRDASGAIIEGDPSELHHVEDHWVFERDVTSKNPNWKIIET